MWRWTALAGGFALILTSLSCGPVDKEAHQQLLQEVGSLDVTVYPAFVRQRDKEGRWDRESSAVIAAAFERLGLGTATVGHEEVSITGGWHASQPKMLKESALSFAGHLAEHPAETGYSFLPEFILGRSGHAARIHGYMVDTSGRIALVILTNSKWEGFDQGRLDSPEACAEYLVGRLEIELAGK
jgi:hypothetical protein